MRIKVLVSQKGKEFDTIKEFKAGEIYDILDESLVKVFLAEKWGVEAEISEKSISEMESALEMELAIPSGKKPPSKKKQV